MKITRDEVEKLLATMYRLEATEVELEEIVETIESADSRIKYFDAGSINNSVINWGERVIRNGAASIKKYDVEYFNPISFAMYKDTGAADSNIRIAPDWII